MNTFTCPHCGQLMTIEVDDVNLTIYPSNRTQEGRNTPPPPTPVVSPQPAAHKAASS